MKKNIEQDVPSITTRKVIEARPYFNNKEVEEVIREMPIVTMQEVLKNLIGTQQWFALLKYSGIRMTMLNSVLRTTNPSKDPDKISWSQGAEAGLCDLENYIIELNAEKDNGEGKQ